MKRLVLMLTVIVFGCLLASAQTSLADAARQAKAEKNAAPAKHVYTNDDIVTPAPAAEKAPAETKAAEPSADAKADANEGDAKAGSKDKKDAKEDAAAKATALKEKIAQQKKAIADQEKDISIMEREHQIRVAEYYADAGTQLRTGEKWFQDEKKYEQDLDAKKKALSDAKVQLDELSDQARKAGAPSS
ncbi:MAG: hypothetical protein ACXVZX_12050 [Terriglobales bacterium]